MRVVQAIHTADDRKVVDFAVGRDGELPANRAVREGGIVDVEVEVGRVLDDLLNESVRDRHRSRRHVVRVGVR
ncbi:MAG TPA: hypothetical protein VFW15_04875, partial [Thermoanaerobaculia bacterium]|nr:hypothetical protein [Thermoanaerobaculia bacterium]